MKLDGRRPSDFSITLNNALPVAPDTRTLCDNGTDGGMAPAPTTRTCRVSSPMAAAFVHGNMPLGAGGQLTAREAWDLAAFIDGQCGPGSDPRVCPRSAGWPSPSCQSGQQPKSAKGAPPVTRW
jgi:hypothetical protein